MNQKEIELSEKLFRRKYELLGNQEKNVAHHLAERTHIARNVAHDLSEEMTFGQKLADKVAAFGGWSTCAAPSSLVVFGMPLTGIMLGRRKWI